MTEQQMRARVRYVIGPDGSPLTVADLPPADTKRWVIRRKAEVVAAVRGGLLSIDEACKEIEEWSGRQFDPDVAEAFLKVPAEAWRDVRERVHREVTALEEQVKKVIG